MFFRAFAYCCQCRANICRCVICSLILYIQSLFCLFYWTVRENCKQMLHVWAVVHPRGSYISLEIIKVSLGICEVWLILMLQKLYYLFLSCVQPCLKSVQVWILLIPRLWQDIAPFILCNAWVHYSVKVCSCMVIFLYKWTTFWCYSCSTEVTFQSWMFSVIHSRTVSVMLLRRRK